MCSVPNNLVSRMQKWPRAETMAFIAEYKSKIDLWDDRNPLYKDQKNRNQRLIELSEFCGYPVDIVKKKIHSLRSAYARELRQVIRKNNVQGTKTHESSWEYFNALQFIKISLMSDITILDETDASPSSTQASIDTDPLVSLNPKTKRNLTPKKKRKAKVLDRKVYLKAVDNSKTFGHYVASELTQMTEINRKKAKVEISKVILKYAEEEANMMCNESEQFIFTIDEDEDPQNDFKSESEDSYT